MTGEGRPMTPRQAEALDFIRDTYEKTGRPPTIREMGKALRISSTNGVRYFLEVLEERGLIERSPRVSRGIRLTPRTRKVVPLRPRPGPRPSRDEEFMVSIPLLGRVAAGEPLLAEQNIEDVLRLDRRLFSHSPDGSFALRVKGDSMVGAGILEGDLVIVRPDVRPINGDVVVAYWEEEATVKRFFRRGKSVILHPENDAYPDIEVAPRQEDFRILGKVVGLIRRTW